MKVGERRGEVADPCTRRRDQGGKKEEACSYSKERLVGLRCDSQNTGRQEGREGGILHT